MTRILLLCSVVLALAACPAPKPPEGPPPAPPTPVDVDTAVKSRVEQYRQGYEVRSLEALEPLYAHDDALVITIQGRSTRGWPQGRDRLAAFLDQATSVKARVSDLAVVALGDGGAVATLTLHRSYGDGVKTVDEIGTLVLVFRRQGQDWLIVAEHFSYAPPSE
jgi:ketosteroid isomerase-like protein